MSYYKNMQIKENYRHLKGVKLAITRQQHHPIRPVVLIAKLSSLSASLSSSCPQVQKGTKYCCHPIAGGLWQIERRWQTIACSPVRRATCKSTQFGHGQAQTKGCVNVGMHDVSHRRGEHTRQIQYCSKLDRLSSWPVSIRFSKSLHGHEA